MQCPMHFKYGEKVATQLAIERISIMTNLTHRTATQTASALPIEDSAIVWVFRSS